MSKPTCFVTFAQEDTYFAKDIYDALFAEELNMNLILDSFSSAENRKERIEEIIENSNYVMFLLSNYSISIDDLAQNEIKDVMEVLDKFKSSKLKIVKLRIDECNPTDELLKYGGLDLYEGDERAMTELIDSFKIDLSIENKLLNEVTSTINYNISFNGVYQSKQEGDNYWKYLKFYEDGLVISVSSTSGDPIKISNWFKREDSFFNTKGIYNVIQDTINFSGESAQGIVNYEGQIGKESMVLNHHSLINGEKGTSQYHFIKIHEE